MTTKTLELGVNHPITISLPDRYWDILSTMAELQGRTVEDLATERLKQIIIEDVQMEIDSPGLYGVLIAEGWRETLKEDPYYKGV